MSINTPTEVNIIVEIESAKRALFSPNASITVLAILSAAPELIKTPARIPAARILSIVVIIPAAPPTIILMVCPIVAPPTIPPINDPSIKLYTGDIFIKINTIDNTNPTNAPKAETVTVSIIVPP